MLSGLIRLSTLEEKIETIFETVTAGEQNGGWEIGRAAGLKAK